jgi:hypothetical protein
MKILGRSILPIKVSSCFSRFLHHESRERKVTNKYWENFTRKTSRMKSKDLNISTVKCCLVWRLSNWEEGTIGTKLVVVPPVDACFISSEVFVVVDAREHDLLWGLVCKLFRAPIQTVSPSLTLTTVRHQFHFSLSLIRPKGQKTKVRFEEAWKKHG